MKRECSWRDDDHPDAVSAASRRRSQQAPRNSPLFDRALRACAPLLLWSSIACTRSYTPVEPRISRHEVLNAAAQELELTFPIAPRVAVVRVVTNGRAGASLRGAKLAPPFSAPCSIGENFVRIEADGVERTEGPLDFRGPHELRLTFVDESNERFRHPFALDLELGDEGTPTCLRVPLVSGRDAPSWRVKEGGAGFMLSLGGRGYPFSTTSSAGIEPLGALTLRIGAAFDAYRLWSEFMGAGGRTTGYTNVGLAIGADRVLWETGRFAVMLGAGYEVVWSLYKAPGEDQAGERYVLHGPRITPSASFTFVRWTPNDGLPAGRRTLYVELEVPTSLWFGRGTAPATTIVPAAGASVVWAF